MQRSNPKKNSRGTLMEKSTLCDDVSTLAIFTPDFKVIYISVNVLGVTKGYAHFKTHHLFWWCVLLLEYPMLKMGLETKDLVWNNTGGRRGEMDSLARWWHPCDPEKGPKKECNTRCKTSQVRWVFYGKREESKARCTFQSLISPSQNTKQLDHGHLRLNGGSKRITE